MGIIKKVLVKYYPHLLHWEFFIRLIVDLIFLIGFLVLILKATPMLVSYCPANLTIQNFLANGTNATNFTHIYMLPNLTG